jgi:hypothetical protein
MPRRHGRVVIASASRPEDRGFESRQDGKFLGIRTLQCCCSILHILMKMKKFLQTHPSTMAIRFFHILYAQHDSNVNWALFRYFLLHVRIYEYVLAPWSSGKACRSWSLAKLLTHLSNCLNICQFA